jgi:hypothetical protein
MGARNGAGDIERFAAGDKQAGWAAPRPGNARPPHHFPVFGIEVQGS